MADLKGNRPRKPGPQRSAPKAASTIEAAERLLEEEEPLSLAEELVDAAERGISLDETDEHYEKIKHSDIHLAELQRLAMPQLIEEARKEKLKDVTGIKKQDLIFKIRNLEI